MKKLILTSVLLSAFTFASLAQNAASSSYPAPHELTAKEKKEFQKKTVAICSDLQKELGLTQDQYDKILMIEGRYQKEVARYAPNPLPAGLNSNLTSEKKNKMQAVLTPEQQSKYAAMSNK